MSIRRVVVVAVLSIVASSAGAQTRSSVTNGETVYLRVGCQACHGTVGQGGAGPRLAPNTLPLAAFETWVRDGTPGWSIASGMPGFPAAIVSLANLPAPRAPDDIALLRP